LEQFWPANGCPEFLKTPYFPLNRMMAPNANLQGLEKDIAFAF
jgi:hypothetical protein